MALNANCEPGTDSLSPGSAIKCCACRKVKPGVTTTVFGAKDSSNVYDSEPDCNDPAANHPWPAGEKLPGGRFLMYTGAKLLNFNGNGCAAGNYAQVMMKVRVQIEGIKL